MSSSREAEFDDQRNTTSGFSWLVIGHAVSHELRLKRFGGDMPRSNTEPSIIPLPTQNHADET